MESVVEQGWYNCNYKKHEFIDINSANLKETKQEARGKKSRITETGPEISLGSMSLMQYEIMQKDINMKVQSETMPVQNKPGEMDKTDKNEEVMRKFKQMEE